LDGCDLPTVAVSDRLLFREGAGSDDKVALNATKPNQGEIVALLRNGDGAVRAAATFVRLAFGDGFDEEDIGFRLPGARERATSARELAYAIEVWILRLTP
jgi:hypothetical protein